MPSLDDSSVVTSRTSTTVHKVFEFLACNVKLDGNNYLLWSQLVKIGVESGECVGFLTGEETRPTGSTASKWVAKDARVRTYLLNHMLPGLSQVYAFLTTSTKIWKALKTKYSQKGYYLQIFRLKKKIQKLEQETMTVDTYFAELSTLLQELDVYKDLYEGLDDATVTKLQTKEERNWVYQFLMSLNSEFDVVVQTTLHKEPFPSLEEAFSAVNQESG
ncbi:UBN2_3 domain-containing protein [Cephalotus follicularis]|uniref:UBN2_3 domain-containing protein n=1 Tax=Cephalotus follicularis TaxID=3775 RepID=A0A1Q3C9S4_CEPFO|nr:UBN2_3 domain-containing protein [Cephalotus follicularis]